MYTSTCVWQGPTLLSDVRGRLIRSFGTPGYSYLRARAMGLAPPEGSRRPSTWRMVRAAVHPPKTKVRPLMFVRHPAELRKGGSALHWLTRLA